MRFNRDWQVYSEDFGNQAGHDTHAQPGHTDGLDYHGDLGIGPYSTPILSQDG